MAKKSMIVKQQRTPKEEQQYGHESALVTVLQL